MPKKNTSVKSVKKAAKAVKTVQKEKEVKTSDLIRSDIGRISGELAIRRWSNLLLFEPFRSFVETLGLSDPSLDEANKTRIGNFLVLSGKVLSRPQHLSFFSWINEVYRPMLVAHGVHAHTSRVLNSDESQYAAFQRFLVSWGVGFLDGIEMCEEVRDEVKRHGIQC